MKPCIFFIILTEHYLRFMCGVGRLLFQDDRRGLWSNTSVLADHLFSLCRDPHLPLSRFSRNFKWWRQICQQFRCQRQTHEMIKTAVHKWKHSRESLCENMLWKCKDCQNSGTLCRASFLALNSKFNIVYVSAALSESWAHLSELSSALSVHFTDFSSSPKDTSEPIPCRAPYRSIDSERDSVHLY